MSNPIINIQNNGTGGNINTAHNMGSITWLSGTVSTAEIKAIRNTPASGDNVELRFSTSACRRTRGAYDHPIIMVLFLLIIV